MRKSVITTATATAFLMIVGFTVRRPDTIAYHKGGLLTAYERAEGGTRERVRSTILIGAGMAESREAIFADICKKYREHQQALLRLGYLEEKVFATGDRPPGRLAYHLTLAAKFGLHPEESLAFFETIPARTNNTLRVVCRREDMARVTAWMATEYVPNKSKVEAELRQAIPKL